MLLILIIVIAFIGVAVALTWFFLANDKGQKEPVSALWIAGGFGLLGAVAAFILEINLLPANDLNQSTHSLLPILGASLGVGLIEEACKFLPLAFFIYKKKYFNEHIDGVIYFALAGLGFGIPENILYTLQDGAHTGLFRLALTPIFHAATTGMVGYFLIKAKLDKKGYYKPVIALIGAMLLHGLYDFGLGSGVIYFEIMSVMITFSMSAMLFILFMRASELDRAQGLSAVGNNSFCRSCGYANPHHYLYCERCGKYA